jgi:hypothetical protein
MASTNCLLRVGSARLAQEAEAFCNCSLIKTPDRILEEPPHWWSFFALNEIG